MIPSLYACVIHTSVPGMSDMLGYAFMLAVGVGVWIQRAGGRSWCTPTSRGWYCGLIQETGVGGEWVEAVSHRGFSQEQEGGAVWGCRGDCFWTGGGFVVEDVICFCPKLLGVVEQCFGKRGWEKFDIQLRATQVRRRQLHWGMMGCCRQRKHHRSPVSEKERTTVLSLKIGRKMQLCTTKEST